MSALESLDILDYSSELAVLPKHAGSSVLPPRLVSEYITFHYSGVSYKDRSYAAEFERIASETRYQMNHNYGTKAHPFFPDGPLYDYSVLSNGTIVRLRAQPVQLWHCGNVMGNAKSWAVHVMLGPGQDMTPPQAASMTALIDALRAASSIPRENVVGHCEWPRSAGLPSRTSTYTLRADGQSACPGKTLFPFVAAYRAISDTPVYTRRYRVKPGGATIRQAWWRTGPNEASNIAGQLTAGTLIEVDVVRIGETIDGVDEWAHLADGRGFTHCSALERA